MFIHTRRLKPTGCTDHHCDALKRKQIDLIQKALEGSIFIADHSTDLPTALTSSADGKLCPVGYVVTLTAKYDDAKMP